MRYISNLRKSNDGYYGCGDEWYDRDIDDVLAYTFITSARKERMCNGCDKVITPGDCYVAIRAIEAVYDTAAKQTLDDMPLRLTFHAGCAAAQYHSTWIDERIDADVLRVNTARFRKQQTLVRAALSNDWYYNDLPSDLNPEIEFLMRLAETIDLHTLWRKYYSFDKWLNIGIGRALALQTC